MKYLITLQDEGMRGVFRIKEYDFRKSFELHWAYWGFCSELRGSLKARNNGAFVKKKFDVLIVGENYSFDWKISTNIPIIFSTKVFEKLYCYFYTLLIVLMKFIC
jgi:hypothetical protein